MYTEASLCEARMNHPRVRVNRLQAKHSGSLLSADVVQLTAARLKAEPDRAVCCIGAVRGGQSFMARDGEMWHGVGLPQTDSREQSPLTVNCLWWVGRRLYEIWLV